MHVLVTRPVEDGAEIAARLKDMGHVALLAPLLNPQFEAGPEPDFTGIQAILVTSANGIRALTLRTARRDIPDLLGAGDAANAKLRIDAVHTGCMTLGLWHVASQLDQTRSGVLDTARIEDALAEVADAVERQTRRSAQAVPDNSPGTLA